MSEFGKYLKELRGDKSFREMERITGLSHTYLSTLEKGVDPRSGKERKPTPDVIRKIAETLGENYFKLMKIAGYMNQADVNELFKKREEIVEEIERERLMALPSTKKSRLLEKEIKELTAEIATLKDNEEKETKLKIISELKQERKDVNKTVTKFVEETLLPKQKEIEEINEMIRTTLEHKEATQGENMNDIYSDESKSILDLGKVFKLDQEISIDGKILTEEEKKKALQILKITFGN